MFAFLADVSGGWRVFVQPKLLLGSLIIGFGVTACKKEVRTVEITLSDTMTRDTMEKDVQTGEVTMCYITEPVIISSPLPLDLVMCYDAAYEPGSPKVQPDTNKIYEVVEVMPSFPGGEEVMMKYFSNNLVFQQGTCYETPIAGGRFVVNFIVERNGQISNIKMVKGIDETMDKEFIKVVASMPAWIPGKHEGENVRVKTFVPMSISLQNR